MNGSMTEFDMKPCRWEKVMAAVIVALVLCALVCASVIVIGWAKPAPTTSKRSRNFPALTPSKARRASRSVEHSSGTNAFSTTAPSSTSSNAREPLTQERSSHRNERTSWASFCDEQRPEE